MHLFDFVSYWPFLISGTLGALIEYCYVNSVVREGGKSFADRVGWWFFGAVAVGILVGFFEIIQTGNLAGRSFYTISDKILGLALGCAVSVFLGMVPVAWITHQVKKEKGSQ